MNTPELLVIGYLSLDRLGAEGAEHPGGGGLYAALGAVAARPGLRVGLVASAGHDFPEAVLEAAAWAGVDVAGVERVRYPTRRARLTYTGDERRRAAARRDADWWVATARLAPPAELPPGWEGASAALVMAVPAAWLGTWVRRLGPRTRVFADTSEAFAARERPALLAALGGVDAFLPGEDEARALLPDLGPDPCAVARGLASCGPAVVVVKRGPLGAVVYERQSDGCIDVPAQRVLATDPTGAGDTFSGAFAASVVVGASPLAAAQAAAAVAARTVSAWGIRALLPDPVAVGGLAP